MNLREICFDYVLKECKEHYNTCKGCSLLCGDNQCAYSIMLNFVMAKNAQKNKVEPKKRGKMKAWIATDDWSGISVIVFAETAGKAKSTVLYCDGFEDYDYIDLRVRREPKADNQYRGHNVMSPQDDEDCIFLVRDLGWYCSDGCDNPEDCPAHQWCAMCESEME